jgi:hypothetical protein
LRLGRFSLIALISLFFPLFVTMCSLFVTQYGGVPCQ